MVVIYHRTAMATVHGSCSVCASNPGTLRRRPRRGAKRRFRPACPRRGAGAHKSPMLESPPERRCGCKLRRSRVWYRRMGGRGRKAQGERRPGAESSLHFVGRTRAKLCGCGTREGLVLALSPKRIWPAGVKSVGLGGCAEKACAKWQWVVYLARNFALGTYGDGHDQDTNVDSGRNRREMKGLRMPLPTVLQSHSPLRMRSLALGLVRSTVDCNAI